MIDRQEADAIAAAIRRGNQPHEGWSGSGDPHAFEDLPLDPGTPEGRREYLQSREGRAEANVAKLIAAQDVRHQAFEDGVAVDDQGEPLEEATVEEMEAQIEELRRETNAASMDPARFEALSFDLNQLIVRKTTRVLTEHLRERREVEENELAEREAEFEDASEVFP